jgi:hypothetical protein
VVAVPVPEKVHALFLPEPLLPRPVPVHARLQLDKIDDSESIDSAGSVDNGMTLPLFSLLALEGGTGCMCAVPGSSIVAVAGKERGTSEWSVHLVDADTLLLLNSSPLISPITASSIVALSAQAVGDGTVHVAAAFLHSDAKIDVAWADASLSSNGVPATSQHAARASSVAFKLGHSVVQAPLMGDGDMSLLLEDDGRARVKQVVGNSLINAALLEGNLLLAWRAK